MLRRNFGGTDQKNGFLSLSLDVIRFTIIIVIIIVNEAHYHKLTNSPKYGENSKICVREEDRRERDDCCCWEMEKTTQLKMNI
jgi:hypothetical protein